MIQLELLLPDDRQYDVEKWLLKWKRVISRTSYPDGKIAILVIAEPLDIFFFGQWFLEGKILGYQYYKGA